MSAKDQSLVKCFIDWLVSEMRKISWWVKNVSFTKPHFSPSLHFSDFQGHDGVVKLNHPNFVLLSPITFFKGMHVVTPSFLWKKANIFYCETSRGQNTSIREQKVKKRAFSVVKLTVWLTIHSPWLKAFVHASFFFNGQKLLWRSMFTPLG